MNPHTTLRLVDLATETIGELKGFKKFVANTFNIEPKIEYRYTITCFFDSGQPLTPGEKIFVAGVECDVSVYEDGKCLLQSKNTTNQLALRDPKKVAFVIRL